MKKGVSFVWDNACQKAFEDTQKPLVLGSPITGRPFLLYVRVIDHSLGALLIQKNDEGANKPSIISVVP